MNIDKTEVFAVRRASRGKFWRAQYLTVYPDDMVTVTALCIFDRSSDRTTGTTNMFTLAEWLELLKDIR